MDLEPHLIKKQSVELDPLTSSGETNQVTSEDDDPYSFNSTSTSLIGLAIVFLMLGVPLIAVISERSETKKSLIPTSINQNGPKSSSFLPISWISKSSC